MTNEELEKANSLKLDIDFAEYCLNRLKRGDTFQVYIGGELVFIGENVPETKKEFEREILQKLKKDLDEFKNL